MSIASQLSGTKVDQAMSSQARIAELTAECDRLRTELTKTQSERDAYLKTVYSYLRQESPVPTFTREEVFEHLDDKPTFEDVVGEIVQSVGESA